MEAVQTKRKSSFPLIAALILTKLGKLAKMVLAFKPLITVVTMSFSAIAYSAVRGPWFGIGLVVMIFIHEMGHVYALHKRGYKVSVPVFIPFLGALIFVPKFNSREDDAIVGIGGPIFGTIAAALTFFWWYCVTNKDSDFAHILLTVSYTGTLINLFNLIPISPLDGGRITQAVGPFFKYVGLTVLGLFTLYSKEPTMLMIWLLVFMEMPMNKKLKFYILSILYVVMMVFFIATGEHTTQTVILGIVGGLVVFGQFHLMKKPNVIEDKTQLPQLETGERLKWFLYYLLVAGSLVWLIVEQYKFLHLVK